MQRLSRLAAVVSIAGLSILGSAGAVVAASPVVGHLYIDANTAGRNTIAAFDRHADGSLSQIPGSPFDAGGAGTGAPYGSAGGLQMSADGRYLLATDPASDQISVLKIQPHGGLRLVDLISSNGRSPVSIAVHGDLVYVANKGAGASDYTGFRLNAGGHLRAIPNSTFLLPDTASPGQVLFSGDGRTLVGTEVGPNAGPSFLDSFSVRSDGRLTAAPGSPYPAQGIGPFGSVFSPTNGSRLFVSNAHDGPGNGSVSVYDVGGDSSLTAIPGSPFANGQTAPCWVEISHDGTVLFSVNTAVPSISSYTVASDGTLGLVGSTSFSSPTGLGPFDARLDPSGSTLYVVDAGAGKVSAFAVTGTSLLELAGFPFSLPSGAAPFGIIVD